MGCIYMGYTNNRHGGKIMKKKIIGTIICMLLIATVLPATGNIEETIREENNVNTLVNDLMIPSGKKRIPIELDLDKTNFIPANKQLSFAAPEYEFIKEPTTIMTTYYDYMPGSYASHPIRIQTDNGDGHYITFFRKVRITQLPTA